MDDEGFRAQRLLTLSSGARRLADLVAAADAPVRFEVLRHLLRVSEETMIEVLEEVVDVRLVRRGDDPFTYIPWDDALRDDLRESMPQDRISRIRAQLAGAAERVWE